MVGSFLRSGPCHDEHDSAPVWVVSRHSRNKHDLTDVTALGIDRHDWHVFFVPRGRIFGTAGVQLQCHSACHIPQTSSLSDL